MVSRVRMPSLAVRSARRRAAGAATLLAAVATVAALAGCGSTLKASPAPAFATLEPTSSSAAVSCPATVLETLSKVLERVYHEGLHGERVGSAEYLVTHSQALRVAVETGNKAAARAAVKALLATGHLTNLLVTRGAHTFIDVGGPALTPLRGTLTGANGAPIANYVTSVWADEGFLIEAGGITQGLVALRAGTRSVGDSPTLGSGALANEGVLTREHVAYRYTSLPAEAFPSGAVRIYLLMPLTATAAVCGHTGQDTTVNTLTRVAKLIYAGEIGQAAQKQIRRVQANKPLLEAVAHRDPEATRLAIDALLHEHVVRLRVLDAGGQLLSDVGGPYVLGPISAPLRLNGRTIGSFVLSIQDDEGYLRLTHRLAGLNVLMYMNLAGFSAPQLVKDSLGPAPGPALASVPASGPFTYERHSFRVFTVHAQAFPSGPLTIRVLVPIPYS
jgi:hypothetical protein